MGGPSPCGRPDPPYPLLSLLPPLPARGLEHLAMLLLAHALAALLDQRRQRLSSTGKPQEASHRWHGVPKRRCASVLSPQRSFVGIGRVLLSVREQARACRM